MSLTDDEMKMVLDWFAVALNEGEVRPEDEVLAEKIALAMAHGVSIVNRVADALLEAAPTHMERHDLDTMARAAIAVIERQKK